MWQLSALPGVCHVVVGDARSPQYPPTEGNTVYLSLADQRTLGYAVVDVLPENCVARAAIGYLSVIQHGASAIYDYDDDNLLFNVSAAWPASRNASGRPPRCRRRPAQ